MPAATQSLASTPNPKPRTVHPRPEHRTRSNSRLTTHNSQLATQSLPPRRELEAPYPTLLRPLEWMREVSFENGVPHQVEPERHAGAEHGNTVRARIVRLLPREIRVRRNRR